MRFVAGVRRDFCGAVFFCLRSRSYHSFLAKDRLSVELLINYRHNCILILENCYK
jgi:hypothetical protein